RATHVAVLLETRDPAPDIQSGTDRVHRTRDDLVVRREASEIEDTKERRIDSPVRLKTFAGRLERPQEAAKTLAVKMSTHGRDDLICRRGISLRRSIFGEQYRKVRGGTESGDDCGTRECVYPVSVFPKIPTRFWQSGRRITIGLEKIRTRDRQRPIEAMSKLNVTIPIVVLPKCPQDQSGLVLLYRNDLFLTMNIPRRMPAGG